MNDDNNNDNGSGTSVGVALLDTPTPVPDTNADTDLPVLPAHDSGSEQLRVLREAHARELAEIARVRQEERQRWVSDTAQLRNEVVQERRKLEEFKVTVRDRALQAKERERWCDAGFNAAMEDLGLPRLVRRWAGTVTVDVVVTGTSSEDTAEMWARNALTSSDHQVTFDSDDAEVDLDESEDDD